MKAISFAVLFSLAVNTIAEPVIVPPLDPHKVPSMEELAKVKEGQRVRGGVARRVPSIREALSTAQKAYRQTGHQAIIKRDDGTVLYPFNGFPAIFTVPANPTDNYAGFRATTLELEQGEKLTEKPVCADETFTTKSIGGVHITIMLMAKFPNLSTTCVVATDRRTYTFNLDSKAVDFMAKVGYWYPDNDQTTWVPPAVIGGNFVARTEPCLAPAAKGHYQYEIDGDDELKPLHVSDDGIAHTWIQLPPNIQDLPAIVYLDAGGKENIVNLNANNGCFKVNRIADRFLLRLNDREVEITRSTHKGGWF